MLFGTSINKNCFHDMLSITFSTLSANMTCDFLYP